MPVLVPDKSRMLRVGMDTKRRFSILLIGRRFAASVCLALFGSLAVLHSIHALENDAPIRLDSSEKPIRLETFRTHSRIVVRLDPQVQTSWKDIPGGFELLLKNITLTDMGAPIGYETEWQRQFNDIRDLRLASVRINETKAGVKLSGKWKFQAGDSAPAKPAMERFEFRQENPLGFVVDFWEQKGPTVSEMKKRLNQERQSANVKRLETQAKRREELRKLAAQKIEQ